eukprot:CAMPEP_0179312544 /NCGR_PEP_ID=MMETSP0797-20121207/53324_1 /TAXON_ID=47934 /ORGANISM="Dinophysis acuminata, Strain DAEP01" /LENGTH=176 /DNA_ID=CAMNT_0021022487 /DNA_START=38 /DNA_END=565 /DNA_ORIENTATION=-
MRASSCPRAGLGRLGGGALRLRLGALEGRLRGRPVEPVELPEPGGVQVLVRPALGRDVLPLLRRLAVAAAALVDGVLPNSTSTHPPALIASSIVRALWNLNSALAPSVSSSSWCFFSFFFFLLLALDEPAGAVALDPSITRQHFSLSFAAPWSLPCFSSSDLSFNHASSRVIACAV